MSRTCLCQYILKPSRCSAARTWSWGRPWMAATTLSALHNRQKNSLSECPGPPIESLPSHNRMPRHWGCPSDLPLPGATWIPSQTCDCSSLIAGKTIRSPNKTGPSPSGQLEPYNCSQPGSKLDKVAGGYLNTKGIINGRASGTHHRWRQRDWKRDRARPGSATVVSRHLLPHERGRGKSHSRCHHRSWRSCTLNSL